MQTLRLGKTGLQVTVSGFGTLPIQRIPLEDAVRILLRAAEGGINFIDTANAYSDSEEKIGAFGKALGKAAYDELIIATKSGATDAETLNKHIDTSLKRLGRDALDLLQLHNAAVLPERDDPLYRALEDAQKAGKVRFIGITQHRLEPARQAVASDMYDTMQFPLSCLSSDEDLALSALCKMHDVGLIAMKAMAGGLLPSAALSMAFLRPYGNIVPIWGVQRMEEIEEVLQLEANPPALDEAMKARIVRERENLQGNFCRGCGYCLPCPVGIPLQNVARMPQLIRRAPWQQFFGDFAQEILRVEDCIHCDACKKRCPYSLDTPALAAAALQDWRAVGREKGIEESTLHR